MGIAGAWVGMAAEPVATNKAERTALAIGEKFGVIVRPMDEKLRNSFGLRLMEGVFVCEILPGSEAETYEIKKGHIIFGINKQQVHNLAEFGRLLGQALQKGAINFSLMYPFLIPLVSG